MTRRQLMPLADRGPLRVMFMLSSMPVGGAETLLVNLVRRLDREQFAPRLCCLQELGPLGETLALEIPAFSNLIRGKYDVWVLRRLTRLLKRQRIDAVVTVGAGDKMFWGRIAAHLAGVPVICSALHSTGWPDVIERPNRWRLLTRWTDAFIAVAEPHGEHLIRDEGFPPDKVCVIPNGIDVARFAQSCDRAATRQSLGIAADAPLAVIVAALRPEKNHSLLLHALVQVRQQVPNAELLVVGDGVEREKLEQLSQTLNLQSAVHFAGNRSDVPALLAASDAFVLTSKMEANPVSILEAMAAGLPVVAPRVGSIAESVVDGTTGLLTDPGDQRQVAESLACVLADRPTAERMGAAGRARVTRTGSLEQMVTGYEELLKSIYQQKALPHRRVDSAVLSRPTKVGA